MKIRIKGNSLRYRLSQNDVKVFMEKGYLEDRICFGTQDLIYALEQSLDREMRVDFTDKKITLFLPAKMAAGWDDLTKIGFEYKTGQIHLLVEKDFQCLDNTIEDQSDNYPNPLAHSTNT